MFERIKNFINPTRALVRPTENSIDGVIGFRDYHPPTRGASEILQSYNDSTWLRAVLNKVGRGVGDTEWKLYAASPSAQGKFNTKSVTGLNLERRHAYIKRNIKNKVLTEIETHPFLDLLTFGNDLLLGKTVIQLTAQYLDLVGEAFLVIERNTKTGIPVGLWPMPPIWVGNMPSPANPYYTIYNEKGSPIEIPITDVIAIKDPNPTNPYGRGTGLVKSMGDDIEIEEYSARHLKAFFYNRARPDVIISGDNIGRDDTERLEQKWLAKHAGVMNQFKPLFFSRKIDVTQFTQNMEQQQMVQIRKAERDNVLNGFGVPPEILGITTTSNRSTISSADLFWNKHVIAPRCEFIRATFQRWLLPQFDDRLILDFESPISEDTEHKLDIMKAAPWAFTVDDWRAEAGSDPLPNNTGEVVLVPVNMQPMSITEDLTTMPVGQSGNTGQGSTEPPVKAKISAVRGLAKAIGTGQPVAKSAVYGALKALDGGKVD